MKTLGFFVIVLMSLCAAAQAITVEDNKIILSPEEKAKCAESGCMVIPVDKLMSTMEKLYEQGKADGVVACKGRT